jgi:U4/U6.U5 tri-snRNP-associated protein 1
VAELSLSVEETNKIRASLNLAPLNVDTGPSKEELAKQQQEREQLEKDLKTIEIQEKLEKIKTRRLLTAKITGKSIAEGMNRGNLSRC